MLSTTNLLEMTFPLVCTSMLADIWAGSVFRKLNIWRRNEKSQHCSMCSAKANNGPLKHFTVPGKDFKKVSQKKFRRRFCSQWEFMFARQIAKLFTINMFTRGLAANRKKYCLRRGNINMGAERCTNRELWIWNAKMITLKHFLFDLGAAWKASREWALRLFGGNHVRVINQCRLKFIC